MAALAIGYLAYRDFAGTLLFDTFGKPRLIDFAAFWAAANHVLEGHASQVYDGPRLVSYEAMQLGQAPKPGMIFPYPPTALLFVWPLGLLGYVHAWIAMQVVGAVVWFVVLRAIIKDSLTAFGMALALGASTYSITLGQNGFLTASLLCGGLVLLDRSKSSAGVMIGLLTFKPHLAAVSFVALLLWREWRALVWAACTATAMALAATAAFGVSIWSDFLAGNAQFVHQLSGNLHGTVAVLMQSPFAYAAPRWGIPAAFVVQSFVAALAIGSIALAKAQENRTSAVIAATLLVTPFSYFYDFTALAGAAAFMLRGSRDKVEADSICAFAVLPSFFLMFGGQFGSVSALAFLALSLKRSRHHPESVPVS